MGHATAIIVTVFRPSALRRVNGFVDGENDIGYGYRLGASRQMITAARSADALDQTVPPQLAEKLLEIRQRNLLPLRDGRKRDGAVGSVQRHVDHGGDG